MAACIGSGAFTASAGSLTPPGPPGPTIQQKPTWDKTIPVAQRFVDALNTNASGAYEAVLDKETGLVWAKTPDTVRRVFDSADGYCLTRNFGGRKGWRLPTFTELSTLMDMSNPGSPKLPAGQTMFQNVQADVYWTSSSASNSTTVVINVDMLYGEDYPAYKTGTNLVWCVRGGQ
jgi:hypothetical protein